MRCQSRSYRSCYRGTSWDGREAGPCLPVLFPHQIVSEYHRTVVSLRPKTRRDGRADAYTKTIVQEEHLLHEIRRTAALWREYWKTHSDGGKNNDSTMLKLNQIASDDFTCRDGGSNARALHLTAPPHHTLPTSIN